MERQKFKRRGLSGIYIFDTFPGEEKRQPTCIEDCTQEARDKYLDGLTDEGLKVLVNRLCDVLTTLGDSFGIEVSREKC